MTKRTTLTVKETAAHLCMSEEHVRRLIRSGELRGCNVGSAKRKVYRVRQTSLDRFLEAREIKGIES